MLKDDGGEEATASTAAGTEISLDDTIVAVSSELYVLFFTFTSDEQIYTTGILSSWKRRFGMQCIMSQGATEVNLISTLLVPIGSLRLL